jgi:F-type H+-transporting ATPase subunit delta
VSVRFARPYAEALLQTTPQGFDYAKFNEGLAALVRAISGNRDLSAVLSSPSVPGSTKDAVVADLATRAGLDETGRRFLALLRRNGRILQLSEIAGAVREALDGREGVVPATVTVAAALPQNDQDRLVEALSRAVGRKVRARFEVDPKILAGFIARLGSRVFDASTLGAIYKFKEEAYGN